MSKDSTLVGSFLVSKEPFLHMPMLTQPHASAPWTVDAMSKKQGTPGFDDPEKDLPLWG